MVNEAIKIGYCRFANTTSDVGDVNFDFLVSPHIVNGRFNARVLMLAAGMLPQRPEVFERQMTKETQIVLPVPFERYGRRGL